MVTPPSSPLKGVSRCIPPSPSHPANFAGSPSCSSHSPPSGATVPDILRWWKLCGDHMDLLILSSFVVVCANCHGTVKMSYKDPYGTYHWKKHRDMCNKRSELEVQYERMRNMRFGEPQIVPLISVRPSRSKRVQCRSRRQ